jgi:aminoglycoside phosphotransferase (APT) family kinase protein
MSRLEGTDAKSASLAEPEVITRAAFRAIAPLHRLDSGPRQVSAEGLRDLIDIPAHRLRAVAGRRDAIDHLARGLHDELADHPVRIGWTHGDFAYGNLMLDDKGEVTGIVDWGQLRQHDLVSVDLAFWLLTMPRPDEPQEFGARVAARLGSNQPWRDYESCLLAEAVPNDAISGRALLLLPWLRHVTDNLDKSDRFAGPLWYRRNIVPVLRVIAHGGYLGRRVAS